MTPSSDRRSDDRAKAQFAANIRDLLHNDLTAFVERAFRELVPGEDFVYAHYIRAICHRLQLIEEGKLRRLLILIGPRHLKSHCASVCFPAWYLGRNPDRKVVCASYNADLAQTFGRDSLRLMKAPFFRQVFPAARLDPRRASSEELRIDSRGGGRIATSVEGTFTGKGADLIVIDDPMKAEDVVSEVRREAVYHWVTNTVMTRFNSQATGAMIVVAQRLHVDDLPGRLIADGGWDVLELPAIATGPAVIPLAVNVNWARQAGTLLQPGRLSRETLEDLRRELGDLAFQTQYQQRPAPPEGNLIRTEWFGTYEKALPRNQYEAIVQSWDTATVPGNTNDYSVCTTFGLIGQHIDLLHVHRGRHGTPELEQIALNLRKEWEPNLIVIEGSGIGIALRQYLNSKGIREARSYNPRFKKEERVAVVTPMLADGQVRLPPAAPWLDPLLSECGIFPNDKHDDQVDSLSQMLLVLKGRAAELRHLSRYKKK